MEKFDKFLCVAPHDILMDFTSCLEKRNFPERLNDYLKCPSMNLAHILKLASLAVETYNYGCVYNRAKGVR